MLRKALLNYISLVYIIFMIVIPGQIELKALEKGGLYYVTVPGSRIWLEGTSTVNDYLKSQVGAELFPQLR